MKSDSNYHFQLFKHHWKNHVWFQQKLIHYLNHQKQNENFVKIFFFKLHYICYFHDIFENIFHFLKILSSFLLLKLFCFFLFNIKIMMRSLIVCCQLLLLIWSNRAGWPFFELLKRESNSFCELPPLLFETEIAIPIIWNCWNGSTMNFWNAFND